MMFSRQREDCKTVFQTDVGKRYCILRRSIVKTALSNFVKDSFSHFREAPDSTPTIARTLSKAKEVIKPFWCKSGFVSKDHIAFAQSRIENVQGKDDKPIG